MELGLGETFRVVLHWQLAPSSKAEILFFFYFLRKNNILFFVSSLHFAKFRNVIISSIINYSLTKEKYLETRYYFSLYFFSFSDPTVGPRPTVWFSISAPMSEDVRHGFLLRLFDRCRNLSDAFPHLVRNLVNRKRRLYSFCFSIFSSFKTVGLLQVIHQSLYRPKQIRAGVYAVGRKIGLERVNTFISKPFKIYIPHTRKLLLLQHSVVT
jgi:hypothetical protein